MSGGDAHAAELRAGERFPFGDNWRRFLAVLDDERIAEAERSLREMLGLARLDGRRFLDIGSGSGLFSLAAHRLGADVTSFDFDPASVACTEELRARYAHGQGRWRIERGSVLDAPFVGALGRFDVVYAWGVLHHTGDQWRAFGYACDAAADGGRLFVAFYNDQHWRSRMWLRLKRLYCSGLPGRTAVAAACVPWFVAEGVAVDVLRGRSPLARYRDKRRRGMSIVRDWFDWLGGLPFEVSRPEEVFEFAKARGFVLDRLVTTSGWGNNEFVFVRRGAGQRS